MSRRFLIFAAVFGALGVGLGAFGSHGLRTILETNGRESTFNTAVQYHLIHAVALLGAAWAAAQYPGKWTTRAGCLFVAGIVLFSGSLYVLALFNAGCMGAVAPFGGAALIGGWLCLGIAAWKPDETSEDESA